MGTKRKSTNTRNGQPLTTLPKGHRRRMADGKNAWRKMTPDQRADFLAWMAEENLEVAPTVYQCATCGQFTTDYAEHTHRADYADHGGIAPTPTAIAAHREAEDRKIERVVAVRRRKINKGLVTDKYGRKAIKEATLREFYMGTIGCARNQGAEQSEDRGTCVTGAGVVIDVIPTRGRIARRTVIASGPYQGNLAQRAYCEPIVKWLTINYPELNARYYDGAMD